MKIMSSVLKFYQNALARHPYKVQAVQSGFLMFSGDIIAQTFVEQRKLKELKFERALQFGSIGFFIGGPSLRYWYGFLTRHIGSTGTTVAVKKVFCDQLIFAPSFMVMLLTIQGTLRGQDLDTTITGIQDNYKDILMTNWMVWPFVQLVNFSITPLQYQVLVVQFVALFWNTYLSWKTNRNINLSKINELTD